MSREKRERQTQKKITLAQVRVMEAAALSRSQVAELFEVDPRTISRAIRDGELPSVKLGNRVFIPREPLLALLAATPTEVA